MLRLRNGKTGQEKCPIRPAVVLVDMQTMFVKRLELSVRARIIKGQIKMIRFCRDQDIPLLVVELVGCGPTVAVLRKEIEEVSQVSLFTKCAESAFTNPRFSRQLLNLNINVMIVAGMNKSSCVHYTAIHARGHEFDVITADELIADEKSFSRVKMAGGVRRAEEWYEDHTSIFPSTDDLIDFIRKELVLAA